MNYKQFKAPPDFFTAGGFSAAMAIVTALKKTNGDTKTNTLIKAMEGMSFDTPKGQMTFRGRPPGHAEHVPLQDQERPGLGLGRARAGARDQA
jgi:ABC-type branched-subunit amino acid transport system substrate-binding protein